MGETQLRKETSAIDRTLFVTGYLSLILGVFTLFSVEMNEVLGFPADSPTIWFSLVECVGLIAFVVAISILVVFCYKKIVQNEKTLNYFKVALCALGVLSFGYIIFCTITKFCW